MEELIVEKAGLLDTIQDQGRPGYQASGMVVAGAMDPYAYQLGNILLGNKRNAASLEVTLVGPHLRFSWPTQIIITGGNLSPKINDQPAPMWQVISVQANDRLTFGPLQSGCRSYLAIKGGIQTQEVMDSRSTYLKGKLGGWKGRSLKKEDVIPYSILPYPEPSEKGILTPVLSHEMRTNYENELTVRVILGPQDDRFTKKGLRAFLEEPYKITPQMDRMGIRLEGELIEHTNGADILSDAMPLGGIQVPANGQPIILMSDRQTTGGYTKIGCLISVDIPKLAQARPNQVIQFQRIGVEEAQTLYQEQQRFFNCLALLIEKNHL